MDKTPYSRPTSEHPTETATAAKHDSPSPLTAAPRAAAIALSCDCVDAEPPSWLDLFDPRWPEAFLAFCSLWCAIQLAFWPNEFATAPSVVTLEIGLAGHEKVWAIFGAVAALIKLCGLAARMSPRWRRFAAGMLASGLFMSIIFWLIVGLSRMVDFPHAITPVALTGLGVAAAFQLAGRRVPREIWR